MDFSIVLPTYNNLDLAEHAINSVLRQNVSNYELIVVDDSSTDIIEHFIREKRDKHIKYHHNIHPLGAVKNWNYGLSLTTGEYVILLHHDECLSNDKHLEAIERQVSNGYDIIIAPVTVFIGNKVHKNIFQNKIIRKFMIDHPLLLYCANAIGPTACICLKRNCIVHFHEELTWLVDVEWYYELLKGRRVTLLSDGYSIISRHGHDDQITNQINIRKAQCKDIIEIRRMHSYNVFISLALAINRAILQLHRITKK